MTVAQTVQVNNALLDAATRLIGEVPEVPAGSILRCFSRTVQQLRREGCSIALLPIEAERITHELLNSRHAAMPLPRTSS